MITPDSGYHPNLRPQDFRLKPNFPGVISRDLLNAEAGQDAHRQDIARQWGDSVGVRGSTSARPFEHGANQTRRGGFGATAGDADIGDVGQHRAMQAR
jgi:hypothetical protein